MINRNPGSWLVSLLTKSTEHEKNPGMSFNTQKLIAAVNTMVSRGDKHAYFPFRLPFRVKHCLFVSGLFLPLPNPALWILVHPISDFHFQCRKLTHFLYSSQEHEHNEIVEYF